MATRRSGSPNTLRSLRRLGEHVCDHGERFPPRRLRLTSVSGEPALVTRHGRMLRFAGMSHRKRVSVAFF